MDINATNIIDTPEFKAWFKNSAVTDETGKPYLVYHGTHSQDDTGKPFPIFDTFEVGEGYGAIFFADQKSTIRSMDFGDRVYEVYLNCQKLFNVDNPADIEAIRPAIEEQFGEFADEMLTDIEAGHYDVIEGKEIQKIIKELGYDGFTTYEGDGKNFAVYNSNQIKIAAITNLTEERDQPIQTLEVDSWFTGSQAVNSAGQPLTLYHGTSADFTEFHQGDIGFHFGTYEQATNRDPNTLLEVNLSIKNPYNIVSDLGQWDDLTMLEEYFGIANEGPLSTEFAQGQINSVADFKNAMEAHGYDGITYENSFEGTGQSWIAFHPEQIKILNTIKSLEPEEKLRNTDTPEFKEWFNDSKIVDENNKPLVLYHGTNAEFTEFKRRRGDIGIHLGTIDQANDRIKFKQVMGNSIEGQNIIPVYLAIKHPLRLGDSGLWNYENMGDALKNAREFSKSEIINAKNLTGIRKLLQKKGYDGIVYRNTGEVPGMAEAFAEEQRLFKIAQGVVGFTNAVTSEQQKHPAYLQYKEAYKYREKLSGTNAQDSYIALEPTQIKSVYNQGTFDRTNPDIRYKISETTIPERADITSPEFKNWFGNSKLANKEGTPIIVWHGVKNPKMQIGHGEVVFLPDFNEFDVEKKIEPGAWFSTDKSVAAMYGTPVPFYLKVENPIRHENPLTEIPKSHDAIYRCRGNKDDGVQDAYEIAVFDPTQIKSIYNIGTFSLDNPDIRYRINAYHGSPHDFKQFSTTNIGTGEGNQSFGYGLYFTSERKIAEYYKDGLSETQYYADGKELNGTREWAAKFMFQTIVHRRDNEPVETKRLPLESAIQRIQYTDIPEPIKNLLITTVHKLNNQEIKIKKGNLFEVSLLPNESDLLDWDKPLIEQSQFIKNKLIDTGINFEPKFIAKIIEGKKQITTDFPDGTTFKIEQNKEHWIVKVGRTKTKLESEIDAIKFVTECYKQGLSDGDDLYTALSTRCGSSKAASHYLYTIGIPGIKYFDGQSRDQGEGTYNYVIFSDTDIEIQKKYQVATLTKQGAISSFTRSTIQKAFPGQSIAEKDGHFLVELKNGKTIRINQNWDIAIDSVTKEILNIPDDAKGIASYEKGTLNLSDLATLRDLHHEAFHVAYDMTLTKTEIQNLTAKFGTGLKGEENAALAYEEWRVSQKTPPRKTFLQKSFGKVQDFLQNLRDTIIKDDKAVFRAIAAGDVWKRRNPSLIETLRSYVNTPKTARPILTSLGKHVWQQGFQKVKPWTAKMRTYLQDTWDNYKVSLQGVYKEVSKCMRLANTLLAMGMCGTFAGTRSATANKTKLEQAKTLQSNNIDNDAIRKRTGWFQGMDGKWRFEIDDSDMKIHHPHEWLSDLRNAYQEDSSGRVYGIKLTEVIKHDTLFQAYPELKDINVTILDNKLKASFNPEHNTIILNKKDYPLEGACPLENVKELKSILIHELQHVIQEREDFAVGGNPDEFKSQHHVDTEKIQKLQEQIDTLYKDNPEFEILEKERSSIDTKIADDLATPEEDARFDVLGN